MVCVEEVGLTQPKAEGFAHIIGDSSGTAALSRFRQMQGKLGDVLCNYESAVLRTIIKAGTPKTVDPKCHKY
jgi:hypothetical protein